MGGVLSAVHFSPRLTRSFVTRMINFNLDEVGSLCFNTELLLHLQLGFQGSNNMFPTSVALLALLGLHSSQAFAPQNVAFRRTSIAPVSMAADKAFDQEQFNAKGKEMRLAHLEEQAMYALKISCENYGNAVFPNAMIAGDCVITDLLSRLGYLENGKAKIMVVDTFHLFPETMEFLKTVSYRNACLRLENMGFIHEEHG